MKRGLWIALFSLISTAAQAEGFENSTVLTSSALSAVVTNSQTSFGSYSDTIIGGTTISGNVFEGALGIIAVVQNSGINSVTQQAVTTTIGGLSFRID